MEYTLRNIVLGLVLFALLLDGVAQAKPKKTRKVKHPSKQTVVPKENCFDKHEMDDIMAQQYTFGNSGRKFPETLLDLPEYCNTTDRLNRQLEGFANDCVMDSFTKNTIHILVNTIRRETRTLCRIAPNNRPSKRQAQLLDTAPCSNSLKDLHQGCIDQGILYFQDSLKFKEPKDRLYYICCNMNKFEECVSNPMREQNLDNPNPFCKPEHAEVVLNFIQSIQGNMINFLCGDYTNESSLCDAFKQTSPNSTVPVYKSLVVPMIDALTLFDYRFEDF